MTAWLLDLLLPLRCVSCGVSADVLCPACLASLRSVPPPLCELCGAPTVWPVSRCRECAGRRLRFVSARAAVLYAGPVRPLLRAWKERGLRRAGRIASELVASRLPVPAVDVITHVPPDPVRQLARGHHPAVELAAALGSRYGLESATLLERTGSGARQTGLHRAQRGRNVRGAFRAVTAAPARVLLVDDVYTTGATTSAAAGCLRAAGAASVEVVTLARTVR